MKRIFIALLIAFATSSASSQSATPPAPIPQVQQPQYSPPPALPQLPPGLSASDRDLILAIIAERDRQYDQRFRAQEVAVAAALAAAEKAVNAALTAAKEAVEKAEKANDKHFDSVNEFRKVLTDQTASFPTRTEIGIRFTAIEDKISSLQLSERRGTGRSEGSSDTWTGIMAGAGLAISLSALLILVMNRRDRDKS